MVSYFLKKKNVKDIQISQVHLQYTKPLLSSFNLHTINMNAGRQYSSIYLHQIKSHKQMERECKQDFSLKTEY